MQPLETTMVVLCNGNVVGMHPNQDAADKQAYEIASRWRREVLCGSEVSSPKIAVLSFASWMELLAAFAF